ncbi:unnamed protein product [Rhizoctonia solani]|uniref:Uncharacterized protein n=1 Tax=Rhizoctonia solani TaxID=456999 RepID=A0A8H2XLM7_9AGAM|nr:unnamed protein product [Rhizoctonia solani]
MSFPTRVELENLKRAALQAKCKELGIKANSKSEVLIDMVLERYLATAGPSKLSTSTPSKKRKADDEVKTRRVKTKVEPRDDVLPMRTSPRHGKVVEVVIRTPSRVTRAKGKGKAKEMTPLEDEIEVADATAVAVPVTTAQPLAATATSATVIDTVADAPTQSQIATNDTRIADLELQIRNARKAGDESTRDVLALKAFQNAIQQAFGDNSSSDTLDSMTQLAKLRDLTPKLLTFAHLDPEAITSRVELMEKKALNIGEQLKQDEVQISDLRERIRKLETDTSHVGELQAAIRQLQSKFNRIPNSVFNNNRPEDSATDNRYTIIRPSSTAPPAGPSGSQQPSSQLPIPEEGLFLSQNQDQNHGRASSVARSSRGSRPPLAEKEKETEETGSRRSVRPSSQSPSRASSQSSRPRSPKPYSRPRSSEPPTPTRSKGKSRMTKTLLETVAEDETPLVVDPFTPTKELARSPPIAVRKSSSPSPSPSPSANKLSSTTTLGFCPPLATIGPNGPIMELPFKLVPSDTKPSSETAPRPPPPSGRVGRTSTRPHTASARLTKPSAPKDKEPKTFLKCSPPRASTTTNGTTNSSSAPANEGAPANGGHVFITPERFRLFPPPRIDLGRTPGGLAYKTTGRAPPGEVARDTRFADLPYDPDASRGSISWEDSLPVWPAGIPRNAANP